MKQDVLKQAAAYSKEHRRKARRYKTFVALAAVVVFCTTFALIMPAATMENAKCGMEEHTHDEACFALTCELPESEASGHIHGEDCYKTENVPTEELICGQEAAEGHAHGEGCYTEETQTVTVKDAWTEEVRGDLTCTDESEEHEHGDDCYAVGSVAHPAETEEQTVSVLTCTEEVVEGHAHSESCYGTEEVRTLVCELEEDGTEGHAHGTDCYELACELPEHAHTDACYADESEPEESEPADPAESETPDSGETPDEDIYVRDENGEIVLDENGEPVLKDPSTSEDNGGTSEDEGETLPDDGFLRDENGELILDENGNSIPVKSEEPDAYLRDEEGNLILGNDGLPVLKPLEEIDDEKTPGDDLPLLALLPEGAEVPEGYTAAYHCIDELNRFVVVVYAPEGVLPEDAELVATLLEEGSSEFEEAANALDEESYDGVVAMDIHFESEMYGGEVEPLAPVYVSINAQGLLPADADPESVAVQHHVEDPDSGIMTTELFDEPVVADVPVEESGVVTVADVIGEADGIVVVTENAFTADTNVAAAFEVDGFSYFTITYNKQSLKVYLIEGSYEGSPDIGHWEISLNKDFTIERNKWYTIDAIIDNLGIRNYTNESNGLQYEYVSAIEVRGNEPTEITSIGYISGYGWCYNESYSNKMTSLHVVYKRTNTVVGLGEQIVYTYVLDPTNKGNSNVQEFSTTWSDNSANKYWLYMGTGKAHLLPANELMVGDREAYELIDNGSALPTDGNYPSIMMSDGVRRTYNPNPNAGENTYRIVWVRYIVSNGYWDGKLGVSGDNGTAHDSSKNTWHVDGYVVINGKQHVVTYNLVDKDTQEVIMPGVATQLVMHNVETIPISGYSVPDGYTAADSTKKIWYTDPACTQEYDFSIPVTSDFPLYAQLEKVPTTYTLTLQKVVGEEEIIDDTATPLAQLPGLDGATFELYDTDPENASAPVATLSPVKSLEGVNGPATVDAEGVELKLDHTYKLVETVAPAGYQLLDSEIYFAVSKEGVVTLKDKNDETIAETDAAGAFENDHLTLTVANFGGFKLPETGGPGVTLYASGGMLLMCAAAFLMYKRKLWGKEAAEK